METIKVTGCFLADNSKYTFVIRCSVHDGRFFVVYPMTKMMIEDIRSGGANCSPDKGIMKAIGKRTGTKSNDYRIDWNGHSLAEVVNR